MPLLSCCCATLIDSLCCVAVPAPPSLYTKVVNSSVVQATWEPSSKMGQHQGFRLFYRRAHTPLFTGPITFPRNVTQYNIAQLGETETIFYLAATVVIPFFLCDLGPRDADIVSLSS